MKYVLSITVLLLATMSCQKDCVQEDACSLKPDPGNCLAYLPRYYFDQEQNKCIEFIYGGCGGVVPFETLEECEKCECN